MTALRSRGEEVDAVQTGQRRHRVLLLSSYVQRLTAGNEQVQPGTCGQQPSEIVRGPQHVLEVVEEQQRRGLANVFSQSVPRPDRLPRRLEDESRVAKWSERHPKDTAGMAVRCRRRRLQGEPRLPGAARAGQREQANIFPRDQGVHVIELLPAT